MRWSEQDRKWTGTNLNNSCHMNSVLSQTTDQCKVAWLWPLLRIRRAALFQIKTHVKLRMKSNRSLSNKRENVRLSNLNLISLLNKIIGTHSKRWHSKNFRSISCQSKPTNKRQNTIFRSFLEEWSKIGVWRLIGCFSTSMICTLSAKRPFLKNDYNNIRSSNTLQFASSTGSNSTTTSRQ